MFHIHWKGSRFLILSVTNPCFMFVCFLNIDHVCTRLFNMSDAPLTCSMFIKHISVILTMFSHVNRTCSMYLHNIACLLNMCDFYVNDALLDKHVPYIFHMFHVSLTCYMFVILIMSHRGLRNVLCAYYMFHVHYMF